MNIHTFHSESEKQFVVNKQQTSIAAKDLITDLERYSTFNRKQKMAFYTSAYQLKDWMTEKEECSSRKILDSVLIVDTRPYISYNDGHIHGACNMYCPPILKRRFAKGGQVHLESMLGCDTKTRLIAGHFATIIVYDEEGTNLPKHYNDGTDITDLNIVYHTLCKLAQNADFVILRGGYHGFRNMFPSLCTNQSQADEQRTVPTINPDISTRQSLIRTKSTPSEPVELLSHLYIGNAMSAAGKDILFQLGITAILNVSNSCQNHFGSDFRYKNIPVDDNPLVDLSTWFMDSISFIDEVKRAGGKTLVHCQAGVSRSATICLAYIMQSERLSLDEAFEYVKSRRNVISPNISFMQQLLDFEKEIQTTTQRKFSTPSSPCRLLSATSPTSFSFYGSDEMPSSYLSQSQILQSPVQLLSPVLTLT